MTIFMVTSGEVQTTHLSEWLKVEERQLTTLMLAGEDSSSTTSLAQELEDTAAKKDKIRVLEEVECSMISQILQEWDLEVTELAMAQVLVEDQDLIHTEQLHQEERREVLELEVDTGMKPMLVPQEERRKIRK